MWSIGVAIKMVPLLAVDGGDGDRSGSSDPKRWESEVELLASIKHRNVVAFRAAFMHSVASGFGGDVTGGCGDIETLGCIVTEYCPGHALADLAVDGLGPAALVEAARQVCEALNYIHGLHILHGDVGNEIEPTFCSCRG
jgi:serine/threonine protein kinase